MIYKCVCKRCDHRCCIGCEDHDVNVGCKLTYEQRPQSCQLYPFVLVNGELLISPECPGMSAYWKDKYTEAKELIK